MASVERSLRVNITATTRGFSTAMNNAQSRLQGFERRLIQTNNQIAQSAGMGIQANQRLAQTYQGLGNTVKGYNSQMVQTAKATAHTTRASRDLTTAVVGGGRSVTRSTRDMARGFQNAGVHAGALSGHFENYAGFVGFQMLGYQAIAMGAAIGIGLGQAVKSFMDFEDSFASVRKTVDASEAEFATISNEIRELARTVPLAVTELNEVAGVAGQLGVPAENIAQFTKVMAQMGVATNITAEQSAMYMARIGNVMQNDFGDDIERMGAAVVGLGNNFAAQEDEILRFTERIAASGKVVGMSTADVLSFSTAFTSVGVRAERGGTAFQSVIIEMMQLVDEGGDGLRILAETAGVSSKEFADAWREDPATALVDFIEGLGRMEGQAAPILANLFGNNNRMIQSFMSLATAGDLARRAIAQGRGDWAQNIALTREAEERFGTLINRLRTLGNQIRDVAIDMGSHLAPAVEFVASTITAMINAFGNAPPLLKEVVGVMAAAAAASAILTGSMLLMVFPMRVLNGMLPGVAGNLGILANNTARTATAMTSAQGPVYATATSIRILAGAALRLMGIVGGLYLAFKAGQWVWNRLQGDFLDSGAAANQLAASMGETLGEYEKFSEEVAGGVEIKFKADNEELINAIADMSAVDAERKLISVGFEMVSRGMDPAEVEESLNRIVTWAGRVGDVDMDIDFGNTEEVIDGLTTGLESLIAETTTMLSRVRITGGGARKELADIMRQVGQAAHGDLPAAKRAFEEFMQAASDDMGAGNVLGTMGFAIEGLFQGMARNETQAKILSDAFRSVESHTVNAETGLWEFKSALEVTEDGLEAVAKAAADMGDFEAAAFFLMLSGATDEQSQRQLDYYGRMIAHLKTQGKEGAEGVNIAAWAIEDLEINLEDAEDALKQFVGTFEAQTDALNKAADPLGRYNEILKEINDEGRRKFEEGLEAEAEGLDKTTSKRIDALRELRSEKKSRDENTDAIDAEIEALEESAKAQKKDIDNRKRNYEEITASREAFLQAQREEIEDQRAYYDNIAEIRRNYGNDIANFYLGLGPEYASLVADMLAGGEKEVREGYENQLTIQDTAAREQLMLLAAHGAEFIDSSGNLMHDAVREMADELGIAPGIVDSVLSDADRALAFQGQVLATTAGLVGENVATELAEKMGMSVGEVSRIIHGYAQELAGGLNPILAGIGAESIIIGRLGRLRGASTGRTTKGPSEFAQGGFHEDHTAQIAPAGAWRVWAEPETGGEAYIPLAPSKRERSLAIWHETGRRLGAGTPQGFAEGGFTSVEDIPKPPDVTAWGKALGHTSKIAMDKVYGDASEWVEQNLAPALGMDGQPPGVEKMMAALRTMFPGLPLISGFRPGAITATGKPSYHGMGRAVDIPPMMAVFDWLVKNYRNSREIIFSPAGNRQIHNGRNHTYSGITKAMHYDHIHWAMKEGGILNPHVRDSGGPLMPGFTYNGTGRPEMVVPMASGGILNSRIDPVVRRSLGASGNSAAGMTAAIEDATKALERWERQLAIAEENLRRNELVGDVKSARKGGDKEEIASAVAALREFDEERARSNDRRVAEARIAQAREIEARRIEIEGNRESLIFDAMTTQKKIQNLDKRMKAEEKFSDAWMDLRNQRNALLEDLHQEEVDRLAEAERVRDDLLNKIEQALKQEADIEDRRKRLRDDAKTREKELLDARTDALINWARLDERVTIQWGNTASAVIRNVQQQTEMMQRHREGLSALRARGLSEDVIEQLGLNDPNALGQVEAFARATDAELADLVRVVSERNAEAKRAAVNESKALGSELNRSIVQIQKDLSAELKILAQEQAEIGLDQGIKYGEAIASGMKSKIPAIRAAAQELAAARDLVKQTQKAVSKGEAAREAEKQAAAKQAATAGLGKTLPDYLRNVSAYVTTDGQYYLRTSDKKWWHANGLGQIREMQRLYGTPTKINPNQVGKVAGNISEGLFGGGKNMEKYAPRVYDVGGPLPPGLTMAYNGTRQVEYVLRPTSPSSDSSAGSGEVVVYHQTIIDGNVVEESVTKHQQSRDRKRRVQTGHGGWQ